MREDIGDETLPVAQRLPRNLVTCWDVISIPVNGNFLRAMAKNGSTRCFFGQKRVYLKTIAAESVVGRI